MKSMKKYLAMLLAVAMLFAFTVSVSAANADLSGHTYVSYQIFTGTQAEGSAQLASIEWGSGINAAAFLSALKSGSFGGAFNACSTAADVAAVIKDWSDDSAEAKAFAKLAYNNKSAQSGGTTGLAAGYYLVVDVTSFDSDDVNTVKNLALLQLTNKGDFEIRNKVSVPEVEKKVKDVNDSNGDASDWQDSADYDIGDNVPFLLTAKLATISDYDTYKVIFRDTLSSGLSYNRDAVVKIDGVVTNAFSVAPIGNRLTITCNNVKAAGATDNSVITVEYTAKLNQNAVIGAQGNPNSVYLEYSNNPNESGSGTGKTPEDKVIVFTYKVVVNKVNEAEEALLGASFELLKKAADGHYVTLGVIDGTAASKFEWKGIDDGEYLLRETVAPKGYNKIDDVEFMVTATHETLSENPALIALEGGELFAGDVATGTLTATVINEGGIVFPETGGRGTTLIYILGAMMLIGASVVLVARKRMSNVQ